MVTRCMIACALLILSGCTDLTEFDHTLRAGINIIHTPDLSVVHTIENISGARSLCPLPDCFIVATMEGKLIRFDLESYQQTGCFTIGSPSSSGYFEIEYSPTENSVYIIEALGHIVELHVPDMEIMDSFIVCETPVDIEIGPQIELPFLYVAGATSSKIFEVRLGTNTGTRSCTLPSSPTCMAINQAQDTILIGTLAGTETVSLGTASMRHRTMDHLPRIQAIETIQDDTTLCAVFDYGSSDMIATIVNYFPPAFGEPCWVGQKNVYGDIFYICTDSFGNYVYLLRYLGDNKSRLISYNCDSYAIDGQIDLEGFPLDLEISPGGTLLVLTTE